MASPQPKVAPEHHSPFAVLCLTALGVVYGDIGTSPLYAMRECFHGPHAIAATRDNVLGVLSLIFWSLILIVSIKYLLYVLRADNRGEGGILSLMALAGAQRKNRRSRVFIVTLGLFGAALLYGDGIITPAISVLSAIEGLEVATPVFSPYIVPLTILVLLAFFLFQRRGTAGVGTIFGPVMVVWFLSIALLGLLSLLKEPAVLAAVNPVWAVSFFLDNGVSGYLVLGAVFLVLTGGEALYADLGHFGVRPIQANWFAFVLPSLLLNYFGQGALLIHDPEAANSPFYNLAPEWALYPLVGLATLATVIASQAVVSGVFSLARQAVQLGYAPRMGIVHTSSEEIGQIYVPVANWSLMAATMGLVFWFRTSSNLAAAYGVAVTATMLITTLLAYTVARHLWRWPPLAALSITAVFLAADVAYFGANAIKIAQGGWLPLLIGAFIFFLSATWKRGRALHAARLATESIPIGMLENISHSGRLTRVSGTAVFMTGTAEGVPVAMLHNLKHNKVIHERNIFLTIQTAEQPYVPPSERLEITPLTEGFYRFLIRFGYMEDPAVPPVLDSAREKGLEINPADTTYILSRTTPIPSKTPGMALWREGLFAFMLKNSQDPTGFFRLPPNRVIELGTQVEI